MRYLETLYCDEVREEKNGKLLFIGAYMGDMLVQEIPAVLQKLVIYVKLVSDIKSPFEFIKLRAEFDGAIIASGDIDKEELSATMPQNIDGKTRFIATFFLVIAPFFIEKEGMLEVYAETDTGKVRGIPLQVKKTEQ